MSLIIGLPADRKILDPHPYHCAGEKYLAAVTDAMAAQPLIIPALADRLNHDSMLDRLDGLMLTGGYSNVEPHHYSEEKPYEGSLADPHRDANSFALIRAAIDRGMPVLGVCRGLQEINVALGGSLHQKIHEVSGFNDHREDKSTPLDQQYGPSHPIRIEPDTLLASIWPQHEVWVNSLHGQGIRALAPGLQINAVAPDGVIEAVAGDCRQGFLLAVQWHPEWKVMDNPFYRQIFVSFADACRKYAQSSQTSD